MADHIKNEFDKYCESMAGPCPEDHDCMACALLWATKRASNQKESGNTTALDLANHLDRVGMIADGFSLNEVIARISALPSGKTNNARSAICRIANQSCSHYGGKGKCELPSTSECHDKQQP